MRAAALGAALGAALSRMTLASSRPRARPCSREASERRVLRCEYSRVRACDSERGVTTGRAAHGETPRAKTVGY